MALNKQSVPINFSQGLDQKTDPYQVPIGRFLTLENTVFTKQGLLQKRNGYGALTSLPNDSSLFLTTFNGNLTTIGSNLEAYIVGPEEWVDKGPIQTLELNTLPLVRSNTNQSQADVAVSSNGLVCTVFTDNIPNSISTTPGYKYVIADSTTGQNVVAPTLIQATVGTTMGSPRVILLGKYFIILFTVFISGSYALEYIAIDSTNPTVALPSYQLTASYTPSTTVNFDAVVLNNFLFIAWNGNDAPGAIRITKIDSTLASYSTSVFLGHSATILNLCADTINAVVYATFYSSISSTGYALAVNQNLGTVLSPAQIINAETVNNITATAQNNICTFIYEINNFYGYDSTIQTDYLEINTVTSSGVVGTKSVLLRSVGLASKAILVDGTAYFLTIYSSTFQPTYFLVNGNGNIVNKLAYSNGGNYYTLGLPNLIANSNVITTPYFFKDLIQAVNKTQGLANAAGIYSQTGINLVNFTIGTSSISTAEIGSDLHISGGFLWMYDGFQPVEHLFHVWPDYVEVDTSTSGGALDAQEYFYQVTYEWSDNQGNIFRSAPSIPVAITSTGSTSSNTISVPTLRLTYKIANPVKIVIYRWSTAQQVYYQVTSLTTPLLNDPTVDYVTYIDKQSDSAILGNNIIYTTGGVLENIAAPASKVITLFNNRLFLVDAEDPNLLWYSKQVIEATPVEMSDLLTIYVAPTISSPGSTGYTKAMAAMDDKLILFKDEAIYYINGIGPDNTGANSQYSDPVFITSTVGCSNQKSIVFMPNGLMFQSDKGIWLLGRDLSTNYIGAPVETSTTGTTVLSAVNVPGTNQVRFTMSTGITLMYDYYYGQWGSFTHVPAISSTLYESLHTYINSSGQVFQETLGQYKDGPNPVLFKFTTSWLNVAGLQGFERAYFFYILGTYQSPHKLNVEIAYDYNSSPSQANVITPTQLPSTWGSDSLWGSGPTWGTNGNIEQWRVFLQRQKCQAFQVSITELYDQSFGTAPGAGISISGLDLLIGTKSNYPRIRSSNSVG